MAAYAILWTIKSDISWTKCARKANEATFPTKFGIPGLMERLLLRSETILTFKSKMTAQKWPPYAIFQYMNNDFSWTRRVTKTYHKMSFPTNSWFADLIEWYHILGLSWLLNSKWRPKTAADTILKPLKVIFPEPIVPKTKMEQIFLLCLAFKI